MTVTTPVPERQTGMTLYRHAVCVLYQGLNPKHDQSLQTLHWKDVWATDDTETVKQN